MVNFIHHSLFTIDHMSDIVIKAENIGKLYKLGEIGTGTISHDLNRWWARVRGKEDPLAKIGEANDRTAKGESDWVWALKDINFEVKQGEVLGIIGRNGAGKSTLLKILSKVTTPTTGKIGIKGRIASLLEVGTGFHPELTGRENVYLNGAILGMRKFEIKSKFEEIVDFAGVERYIDTPVKRYSSGMYVRLAFAVAAFLEPEILIIDEVLAVGDAEFQKKCLGRMKDVSMNDGRTVLFVSHHMGSIAQLCKKVLILNKGEVFDFTDNTMQGIEKYLNLNRRNTSFESDFDEKKIATVKKIKLSKGGDENSSEFTNKDEITIEFELGYEYLPANSSLFVTVVNQYKMPVFSEEQVIDSPVMKLKIFPEFLVQGAYSLSVIIHLLPTDEYFRAEDICPFNILDTDSKMIVYNNYNYNYGSVFGKTSWIKV